MFLNIISRRSCPFTSASDTAPISAYMSHGLKNSKPIQLKGKRNSRGQEKRCPKKRPKKEYSKERSHMNCQYATKLTHHNPTLCGKAAAWLPSFCGEPCPCCMTTAGLALLASRSRQIEGEQNCGWERHSSSLGTQAPKPKAAHCHAPLKPPPHHLHDLHHLSHCTASISSSPFIMFFLFTCGSHSTSPVPSPRG